MRGLGGVAYLHGRSVGVERRPATVNTGTPEHGFILYVDADVWVHTNTKSTSTEYRDPDEIAVYRRMWDLLAADALFGDEARAELDRITADLISEHQP